MSNWRGKSLWTVSSRFAAAGLAFVVNVLLARSLSQDDLGLFFLSVSIAWGGALLGQWGTSILAVKWVTAARARQDADGVRSAVWSLIGFTSVQGLAMGSLVFLAPRPAETTVIWALWVFAVSLQTLLPEILRGFDDLKWASLLLGPIPQLVNAVLLLTARQVWNPMTFHQAGWLFIIGNFICLFAGIALISLRAPIVFRFAPYKKFLHESTPIALSLGATYLLAQSDLWVCGKLLGKDDVAIYGVAQRFVLFVSMPMMVLGSVISPTIAELIALNDKLRLNQVIRRGTFLTSLIALVIFLGGVAIGWPVMRWLFGATYGAAYPLFVILGAGQVIHAFAGPNGYILLLSGEQRSAMFATISAAILLAIGAWLGGTFWGAAGVAFGSSFALTVQSVWMWIEVRRRLKISSQFRWSET